MGSPVIPPPGFLLDDEIPPPPGFLLDDEKSAAPLKPVVAPVITPRAAVPPPAPIMQGTVDPFAPKQNWIPNRPKMVPPPPPSPVEAPMSAMKPVIPGPIEKVQVTSPVGQTNAPVPGRIPGMERLGGAAPGVPRPALPQVGQPPLPRQPMEEYMGPRSDEFVIADDPIPPAFIRGTSSATVGTAGGILQAIGESRSGSARPLPSGPNFAGLPGSSEQTPAGAMLQSAGAALSSADESVQQTFARDASIKDFMTDPKGAMTDPRWWMDATASAAGSMLPMALSGAGTASAISRVAASRILAPEVASAAVKYGPTVAASLAESAQVYGSTYGEARKAGLDPELAREAAALVAAGTGLTAIPAHKVGIFNDQIRSVGRRIATAAVAEGGQEGVQTWWENVIAKTFYDPKRPLMQGVPEAVVGSAIVGGTMGSGGINEQTPAPPTPEMQQEFAGLERENRAPQTGIPRPPDQPSVSNDLDIENQQKLAVPPGGQPVTAPPPAQPIVPNDISVEDGQKQAISPPGAITPPPAGFVVDEEKSPVPKIGTQPSVAPNVEPIVSQVPAPGPREEVVQPKTVDAASPVVETIKPTQEPNAPLSPETPPSPGPVEDAAPAAEPTPDPDIFRVPTQSLSVDPIRFQYKVEGIGQGGVNEELKASKKWDPALAGVISVWKDPSDGRTYVVNGHHRFDLASRLGVPSLTVRYINTPDAASARAAGALMNIAEGRGTAIDAAKFMRDTGTTAEEIEAKGVSLKGLVAREGSALANLAPSLFDDVVHGNINQKRAVIIGENLPDHADQMGAMDVLRDAERRGKRLTDAEVRELIRRTAQAERKVEQQDTLFGVQEMTQNLALEEAQLSNFVRSRLGNEKKLFSTVGSQSAAERLAAAGNTIDAAANQKVAEQADQALAVYDKLSLSAGPISDALRDGARRVANGEKLDSVKEGVYTAVRDSVARLLGGSQQASLRATDAGAKKRGDRGTEESGGQQEAAVGTRASNTVEQTPDGPQETLVTDIEARESQLAAKRDRTTPLVEVPFSLVAEEATAPIGPDPRQDSMFGDDGDGETAAYAPRGGVVAAKPPAPRVPAGGPKQGQPRRGKTGTQISRGQIVRDLSTFLDGIPIKTGGFAERAMGVFKTQQRVIRTKKPLDLPTISHEIGHAIHKYLWGTAKDSIVKLNTKPLRPFKKELGPLDYDQTKKRPFEGFAEYIRMRLTEPNTAQKAAPQFHAWFERKLSEPANKDLAEVLRQAEKRIRDWNRQPATVKIAASINTQDAEPKQWLSMMERVWSDAIDDRYAIAKAVREMLVAGGDFTTGMDAYSMSRLLSGWAEKAQQFLEHNSFNAKTLASEGKGFKQIVKPLYSRKESDFNPKFTALRDKWGIVVNDDNLDDFRIFLIAKRMEDYQKQGMETGFSIEEVQEAIASTRTKAVEKAAAELQSYQDDLLQYVVDMGGLSEEAADMIRSKNSFYAPMYRVMDNSDVKFTAGGRKMLDAASPIRRRKGSVREIVDPLESIVKNTYAMISYADRNAVGQALVKQVKKASNQGTLLEFGIAPGMKVTKFNLKEVEPQITKMLEEADIDPDSVDMDVVAAIYRPNSKPNKAKNQVVITVDGVPQLFEMHPDLIKSMSVTSNEATHLLEKILQAPANILRFGATGAGPEFVLRNPLKDTWAAYMQSRNGFIPIVDTIAGGLAMIFNKPLVDEMVRAGGGGAGIMPMGRKALRRYIDEMMVAKPQYVMRHPGEIMHVIAETLRMAGEFTERATRVGEYRLARKKGKSPAEAAMDARDVTLDFSRQGAVARKINPYVAFFSASLNGTSRFFEEHAKHPARSAIRGLVGTTIPTILLWMLNKDDEEYREVEEWKKSLFWLIPTRLFPDFMRRIFGPFIMIPRANLYGLIYGNMVERMLDATYKKNPDAFKGFAADLFQSVTPPILPSGATPIAEAQANYSFFTRQNIDSRTMENLQAQYRSRPSTSTTAKAISKSFAELGFEISPLKIEHVFFGMTAGLGRAAVWGVEKAIDAVKDATGGDVRTRPIQTAADTPVWRAFATPEVPNSPASVTKFYERIDALRKIRDSYKLSQGIPNGPAAGARPLTAKEKTDLDRMERASRELSGVTKQESVVQYSKTMDAELKRKELNRLKRQKVNIARKALGLKEIYR